MQYIDGLLTIFKRGNFNDERMCIQLTDQSSGLEVANIEMDVREFMRALTGSIVRDCRYECYSHNCNKWGKKPEFKEERMPKPSREVLNDEDSVFRAIIADYRQKYGYDSEWKIHASGINVMQKSNSDWVYTLVRYVDNDNSITLKESEGIKNEKQK